MNYVNIDLDNGLSPEQRQASVQSRAETSITIQNIWFSFSNIHLAILPQSQWDKISVRVSR